MYAVVADVANYKHFVPWCVGSRVLSSQGSHMEAEMTVGFRMFTESYISKVKLDPPRKVVAIAKDTQLFRHLQNTWLFEPGPDPNTTWLHFSVDFQFRSMLYSQASGLFLNEVAHRMSAVATAVSLNRDKASRSKAGSSNASQAQALLACTLSAPVLNVASVLHCPSTSSSTFTSVAHWFLKEKPHKSLLDTMTSTLNMLRSSLSALLVDVSQCRTRMMQAMQQIPPTPHSHQARRSHNQLP